jgi:uncharacterized protein YeeX (DUF496 family)
VTDWRTEMILRELGGAAKGFDIVLTTLADAVDYAERAAATMARFPGVARGIRQIKAAIEDNRRRVQTLADRIALLGPTVEAVTADSTPGQVIAPLAPVLGDLDQRAEDTMRMKASLGETEALIRRNLEGGQPEHLLYRMGTARSVFDAIRLRLDKAERATDSVLVNARQAGDAGGGQGGPTVQKGTAGGEPVGRDAPVPSYVRDAAARLRVPTGSRVAGVLVSRDGRPLHDPERPLVNGKRGRVVDHEATLRSDDPRHHGR